MGTEKLVQQIAVAGLDVDERESGVASHARGADEMIDKCFDRLIGQHGRVIARIDAEACIEQRVVINDAWFEPCRVRAAKASGVGQLQADEQIIGRSVSFAMRVGGSRESAPSPVRFSGVASV